MQVKLDYDSKTEYITIDAPHMWGPILKEMLAVYWRPRLGLWRTKATWPNYLRVFNQFNGNIEIEMSDELKQWITQEYQEHIYPCVMMRDQLEPDDVSQNDSSFYQGLYPFQIVGANFLVQAKRALLGDDMGSGKTITSLSAAQKANAFPLLIITLKSTKFAWEKEVNKYYPGHSVYVVDGTTKAKKDKVVKDFIEEQGEILIMTWEMLAKYTKLQKFGSVELKHCIECGGTDPRITPAKCEVHKRPLNGVDFKGIILDEAHKMKDPKTKTSMAVRGVTGDAEYRWALTGTPIGNSEEELFSVLNWFDPDSYPSKIKFIERYFMTRMNYAGYPEVIGIKSETRSEWDQVINPILRRMPKELILPFLPPIVYKERRLDMLPKQKTAYNQMKDQMVADVDGGKITVTQAMSQITRLLQLASSFAEVENTEEIDPETGEEVIHQKVTLTSPSNKIDSFMEDLPDYGESQIVVFAQSKQLLLELEKAILKENVKRNKPNEPKPITYGMITGDVNATSREDYITRFQNGELKLMLISIAAGGTGITLTNADVAVFLNRSYNAIDNKQALGRVHRIGSEKHESILCVDYISEGTVDEAVLEALDMKGEALENILQDKKLLKKMLTNNTIKDDK